MQTENQTPSPKDSKILVAMSSTEHAIHINGALIRLSDRLRERVDKQRKMLDLYYRTKIDPTEVEAGEWDELTKEFDEMDLVPIKKTFPMEEWPKEVPYPNLVALQKWADARMAGLEN